MLSQTKIIFIGSPFFQVCNPFHRPGRPHVHPELPKEHGLRDHRVADPHVSNRLHQSSHEQLAGSCPRPLALWKHQHHRSKPGHREHQDQGGGSGDHGCGVSRPWWTQKDPGGHAALPTLRLREDEVSGGGKLSYKAVAINLVQLKVTSCEDVLMPVMTCRPLDAYKRPGPEYRAVQGWGQPENSHHVFY